jgi:hypothetical protein
MFNLKNQRFGILAIGLSLGVLVACGDSTEEPPPAETHTIGGTVTGLDGSLTLRNNGTDEELTITTNGEFTFEEEVGDGDAYNVVPLSFTDPDGCSVINGSGTANGNVTSIEIDCT